MTSTRTGKYRRAALVASLAIFLPCMAPGQANWQYGANTISAPSGTSVAIGKTSPNQALDVAGHVLTGAMGSGTLPDGNTGNYHLVVGTTSSSGNVGEITAVGNNSGAAAFLGGLQFANYANGAADKRLSAIYGMTDGAVNSGSLVFYTWNAGVSAERMRLTTSGNLGIGTANPQNALSVNGTIQAKEVLVNSGWADYVFAPGYHLRTLSEVAAYIEKNQHLPDIPAAADVEKNGIPVGEMESKLLAKVEELTLHMIDAEQRNQELERENRETKERLARLEEQIVKKPKIER